MKRHNKNLKSKINNDELLGIIWEYKGKMGGGDGEGWGFSNWQH